MSLNSEYANVVTTIQNPTKELIRLSEMAAERKEALYVIGDKKTPLNFSLPGANYLSTAQQESLDFQITNFLPWNSYTRKLLGYLSAAKEGYKFIRETDDDNLPLESYFFDFPEELTVRLPKIASHWLNPYIYFSDEYIWPRGFPIELVEEDQRNSTQLTGSFLTSSVSNIGVVQGLANGAPDVDALYRLLVKNSDDFRFKDGIPVVVPKNTYAPFNSQVTTWSVALLPLMYLPQTCTFRMTDIWRSYIATHLLHLNKYEIVFLGPLAFQDRNEHNLLKDFSDEVPGYEGNSRFVLEMQKIPLIGGIENLGKDLYSIYQHLHTVGFFASSELDSVRAWINDCDSI